MLILLDIHILWGVSNDIATFYCSLMPTDYLIVAFVMDDYINVDANLSIFL